MAKNHAPEAALCGKVQITYIDPACGIKYDSNFQQRVDSIPNQSGPDTNS